MNTRGYFYSEFNKSTGCWEMTYRFNNYTQVAQMNIPRWKDEGRMRIKIIHVKIKMRLKVCEYFGRD